MKKTEREREREARSYFDENGVAAENLELVHGVRVQADDRVVIVDRLVNDQPIRRFFPLQNRRGVVLLPGIPERKNSEPSDSINFREREGRGRKRQ